MVILGQFLPSSKVPIGSSSAKFQSSYCQAWPSSKPHVRSGPAKFKISHKVQVLLSSKAHELRFAKSEVQKFPKFICERGNMHQIGQV